MTKVWQIACGERGRFYAELFIRHDIMLMGPGDHGSYQQHDGRYERGVQDGWISPQYLAWLKRFCCSVGTGDVVLMRQGNSVQAVGIATGDYRWSSSFDDIYGWNLQHVQSVLWQEHLVDELRQIQSSGPLFEGRRQIPTFTQVHDARVLDRVQHLFDRCREREALPPPDPPSKLMELDEFGEALFQQGIANESVEGVLHAIKRQRRLLHWYQLHGEESTRPQEHEVVAHMVLPLLLGLGWSEQLLAIEWKRVDLAAFSKVPTNTTNCVLVCEAKGLQHGMSGVVDQAVRYVERLGLRNCRTILTTQGGRFYVYTQKNGRWADEPKPTGYFNIEKLRLRHLLPADTSAVGSLVSLTPARLHLV